MKKIAIDMSPIVHGTRAVGNCTACITKELIKNEDIEFNLFYFDYKFQAGKHFKLIGNQCKKKTIPLPYKLLIPAWKGFLWPHFEIFFPDCDILYVNEFYFPPAKKTLVLATIHGLAYRVIPDKISPRVVRSLDQGFLMF